MEGVFAETKVNHGLGRAQWRGRANTQIQVYLIAMTYNLKRLAARLIGDFVLLFLGRRSNWAYFERSWDNFEMMPTKLELAH
jgi:hypothetical protein